MVEFTIFGEPASKSNARRLVRFGDRVRPIKSAKALSYLDAFRTQCPELDPLLMGDVGVEITIHYASRRPDLDESLILDAMEKRVYKNDRQVKVKKIFWALDRENPRADIRVWELGA